MLSSVQRILACLATFLAILPAGAATAPQAPVVPASVVVVANKSVAGSVEIARKYASVRNIPETNLLFLQTSDQERISRNEYTQSIHNFILEALLDRDIVNGIKGEKDAFGRTTVMLVTNPVRYMVLCYGVPTTVSSMPAPGPDDKALRTSGFRGNMAALGRSFGSGPLAKDNASVDGELALILQRDVPLTGFIPNPFFRNSTPEMVTDYIKVMRLDGPDPDSVFRLIDNTLAGEQDGLRGRAYIDLDGRSGAYQMGNDWMERVATVLSEQGFPVTRHPERPTFPADCRFDAPVLYAGWYAGKIQGPFTLPGFQFPPGAIAAHLHSSSASPLRSTDKGWVGPFIARGACATFGNVAEPYLPYTHHFDLYFKALAEGWSVADAAYAALPALSWQAVSIGDPFYRPFQVSLKQQLESLENEINPRLDPYVLIRKINLLLAEGADNVARDLAGNGMLGQPAAPLALVQAELIRGKRKALRILQPYAGMTPVSASDWGLFAEIADTLLRLGDADSALCIYKALEKVVMPEPVRLAFLRRGLQSARKADDKQTVAAWNLLLHPPPPDVPEMTDTNDKPGN